MPSSSILWTRLDGSGHEAARLIDEPSSRQLIGSAVFADAQRPVRLEYQIICDASWRTASAVVRGWLGAAEVRLEIAVREDSVWSVNGRDLPSVAGCVDIDLNFSPSTNLLPVRRLSLAVGESSIVRAAWLKFPSFELEVLDQIYRRLDSQTYEYASDGGRFTARLEVNDAGFPISYGDLWRAEAMS